MGLLKCGECGATITAEFHKKYYKGTNRTVEYVYYRCTKKLKVCTQKYIAESELELKTLDEKLNKLLDGYLDGVIESEVYKTKWFELARTFQKLHW